VALACALPGFVRARLAPAHLLPTLYPGAAQGPRTHAEICLACNGTRLALQVAHLRRFPAMHSIMITGAASGIGAGVAAELAQSGHHVIVSDLKLAEAQGVAEQIRQSGGSAEAVETDVSSDQSVKEAIGRLSRPPEILVNNAGLQFVAPLEQFPLDRWEYLIQVMLIGSVRLTRAVLPMMRERRFGRIINIGSIHSLVASPYKSAYVAAKHGLVGFSKTIALETANTDITINTICPSYVKTPLVDQQIAAQARSHGISEAEVIDRIMLEPMPKRVFIGIDELTGIIAFLASAAARNITGQTIVVDGGWTIR
jgi:3-hydroxybutyrate dehydrogenase